MGGEGGVGEGEVYVDGVSCVHRVREGVGVKRRKSLMRAVVASVKAREV